MSSSQILGTIKWNSHKVQSTEDIAIVVAAIKTASRSGAVA
jgi:hypothetical protein